MCGQILGKKCSSKCLYLLYSHHRLMDLKKTLADIEVKGEQLDKKNSTENKLNLHSAGSTILLVGNIFFSDLYFIQNGKIGSVLWSY